MATKVIVITNHGYTSLGGLEKHAFDSCLEISKKKKEINIMNLYFADKTAKYNITENFACKSIQSKNLFGFYAFPSFSSIYKFIIEINKFKPDLIHTHNRYVISTWIATVYSIIRRIPRIHSEHASNDNFFESFTIRLASEIIDHTFALISLRTAKIVTCVSYASKKYVESKFHIKNIKVVHNFINTKSLINNNHRLSRELEHFLKTKQVIFLWAGRFVDSKNFKFFLKFALKHSQNTNFGFIIVGDGNQKEEVTEYIIKNHLEKELYYGGLLKHEELIELMKKSDVYVNSSSLEGLSTTLLEARFLQLSIISSDISANKEALMGYNSKILFDHKMPNQKAIESINIKKFLDKNLRLRTSKENFPAEFALEHSANQYLSLYLSITSHT